MKIRALKLALRIVDNLEVLGWNYEKISSVNVEVVSRGFVIVEHRGPADSRSDTEVQLVRRLSMVATALAGLNILPEDLGSSIASCEVVEVVFRTVILRLERVAHGRRIGIRNRAGASRNSDGS